MGHCLFWPTVPARTLGSSAGWNKLQQRRTCHNRQIPQPPPFVLTFGSEYSCAATLSMTAKPLQGVCLSPTVAFPLRRSHRRYGPAGGRSKFSVMSRTSSPCLRFSAPGFLLFALSLLAIFESLILFASEYCFVFFACRILLFRFLFLLPCSFLCASCCSFWSVVLSSRLS